MKEFIIVRGLASTVEIEVNQLLSSGYDMHGTPFLMTLKESNTQIICQPMRLNKSESKPEMLLEGGVQEC